MRLKDTFIIHNTGDECLLVPSGSAGFSGVVRGNRTLGAILEQLKTETTEDAVVAALCAKFDASESVITADVKKVVDNLRGIGAIEE